MLLTSILTEFDHDFRLQVVRKSLICLWCLFNIDGTGENEARVATPLFTSSSSGSTNNLLSTTPPRMVMFFSKKAVIGSIIYGEMVSPR